MKACSTFEDVHVHTIAVLSTETLLVNYYYLLSDRVEFTIAQKFHVLQIVTIFFHVSPQDGRLNHNKPLESPHKIERDVIKKKKKKSHRASLKKKIHTSLLE